VPALRLPQLLAKLDRYVCGFLDEIGYLQHDRDEMKVLFTLLAERCERRSVAISILWNHPVKPRLAGLS
jgi:DNA replication protein DnaC